MSNESKWSSEFGSAYTERNNPDMYARERIFDKLLGEYDISEVLEVGCNKGHNLDAIYIAIIEYPECGQAVGVDVNIDALKQAKDKGHLVLKSSAYDLPFMDKSFDLVFTAGVLIHLDDHLKAMQEIYRVSNKYILSIEYFDKTPRKIEYREGVLCQAMPWDKIWLENFTNLKVIKQGEMKDFGIDDGTDFSKRCDYILLEKI